MSITSRTLAIACLAFVLPVAVAIGMNWDAFQSQINITPETARGRVLCFTAPG